MSASSGMDLRHSFCLGTLRRRRRRKILPWAFVAAVVAALAGIAQHHRHHHRHHRTMDDIELKFDDATDLKKRSGVALVSPSGPPVRGWRQQDAARPALDARRQLPGRARRVHGDGENAALAERARREPARGWRPAGAGRRLRPRAGERGLRAVRGARPRGGRRARVRRAGGRPRRAARLQRRQVRAAVGGVDGRLRAAGVRELHPGGAAAATSSATRRRRGARRCGCRSRS